MPSVKPQPQWTRRVQQIEKKFDRLRIPRGKDVPQDAEWCEVVIDGRARRIRFHDYDEVYKVPGLYEELFYKTLKCCSPSRTVQLLHDVLEDFDCPPKELRVLDVGAGNGCVGDELRARGVPSVVGIDIIPEAKLAAQRDRGGIYDDYLVADLTDLPEPAEKKLRHHHFNCLITVAALGFGDIPPRAMLKALDLIETPSWAAWTIKEDFLHDRYDHGFARLIRQLAREEIIQIQSYRRFRHRLSSAGEPLYYVAMVARKVDDIPDRLFAEYARD
jgi:SAM-dependent methyltransferase